MPSPFDNTPFSDILGCLFIGGGPLRIESPADPEEGEGKVPSADITQLPAILVDWEGPEDPENPQNWSTLRKSFVLFQICLLTLAIYVGSAIITPAEPVFVEIYDISVQISTLALSVYVLGYGFGPLLFSPLSEMPRLGRNIPYMTSFFLFLVVTAIASRVSNYPGLIVLRFIQGFLGGPALATGGASLSDVLPFNKVPYGATCWMGATYIAPSLGPILTGFSVPATTWRWSMITVQDPSVAFINLYTALAYGIYYTYFEAFPLVYMGTYGLSTGLMGVIFLSIIVASLIGGGIYVVLVWRIYEPYTLKSGIGKPEYRLIPGRFAAAVAPTGLFLFGWTSRESIHWIVPTIGIVIFSGCLFIVFSVIIIYLPTSYPRYAASLFAANGFIRSALACGAIHFSQPLFGNLGIGRGCSVLGGLAAMCFFGIIALWHYGAQLRARSRFAETY
ncbi:hypothetical protein BDW72DRAFT_198711 [Aspergillus terricola var. indicus]